MHRVGIVVRDLERADAFVTGALGLPVVNRLSSAELGVRTVFWRAPPPRSS
jgi:catechol 2,3-dioxygenase-like lactoylglutathione lyase family enzyme